MALTLAAVVLLCLGSWAAAEGCSHEFEPMGVSISSTQHAIVCSGCGYQYYVKDHYEVCDTPGECRGCLETGVELAYTVHFEKYRDLGDMHQKYCSSCNVVLADAEEHNIWCTDPAYCTRCGLDDLSVTKDLINHKSGSAEWVDLGNGMHQKQCNDCGELFETEDHWQYCYDPSVCAYCGATGLDPEMSSHHVTFENMGAYHLATCVYCDEFSFEEAHFKVCTSEENVCVVCGVATDQIEVSHYHENGVCVDCGHVMECDHYSAACNAPTVCGDCGATGITASRIYHPFDFIMVDDGVEHHQECSGCGEVFWTQEHYIACIAEFPAICWVCHFEIGEEAKPSRLCSEVYEDHGDTHYIKCELCGKVTEGEHEVACTNPSYCAKCKAENVSVSEDIIRHGTPWVGQDKATYNDETHTYTCPDCDKTVTRPHEYDKNGNDCMYCDYWRQSIYPGDADNSNGVSLADAIAVLQYCADDSVSINTTNADVTGDGMVNEQDLLRLLQYNAGWDVTLE